MKNNTEATQYISQVHNNNGASGHGLQSISDIVSVSETVMYWHNEQCLLGTVTGKGSVKNQHCLIVDDKIAVTHIV